jgi:hypothetical protein
MFLRGYGRYLVVGMSLLAFCAGSFAQTEVYKWVDEDGVVHFGDAPPDGSAAAETVVIPKAPPAPTPVPSLGGAPAAAKTDGKDKPVSKQAKAPPSYQKIDISELSIADLNRRCDVAREERIAPLREAEIAKCKQGKRDDPAFCERFNADFGEGGRNTNGTVRPRMFDDLPECVDAMQETNRRKR